MSTVYVPQVPRKFDPEKGQLVEKFDTLDLLEEFGQIQILLTKTDDAWNPENCLRKLKRGLSNFSNGDYLLLMGNQQFIVWTTMLLVQKVSYLQTIQWHPKDKKYRVVTTDLTLLT